MAVLHPLAYLATFIVVFACAVGALPLGWYGSSYYPMTSLGAPYLGQYGYFQKYPFTNLNLYNPYQSLLDLLRTDSTKTNIQDIPSSLATDKGTNWVLTIMKWPGWDTVITDDKAKKKWKKLIGSFSNFTDINNPEWSKQLRQWIEKQADVVSLFSQVSKYMAKSPEWEKNIKVWLNFTSISADYVDSFKQWLKRVIAGSKPKTPSGFPGTIPPFPTFPSPPWQPPIAPWMPSKNLMPGFGVGGPMGVDPEDAGMVNPQVPGMVNPGLFEPGQGPSGPMGVPPFFYPQPCTDYECSSSSDTPPTSPTPPRQPNFPQSPIPNFPQSPIPNFPQSPVPNFPQPPTPNFPQPPTPNFPQPPTPNFPQPPTPNFPQSPIPNFPQPSIPNFPQPSIPDFPQSPFPNLPQSSVPNFPEFPSEFPQFQPPQEPFVSNPYPDGSGFDENPFSGLGLGIELPNFNNIRQKDLETATENQSQNQVETIPDTQANSCPQCEEISIILDLRRSNLTFCKTVLTAPRQSLKKFLILAAFENKCFNLTTKVRDSRLWGEKGEYIFSLNGLPETIFNYWISYKVNGEQDTELNTFQPQNGDHIIIDYTDWKTIANKIAVPE